MTTALLSKKISLPLSWIRAAALLLQLVYLFWLGESPKPIIWVIMVFQLVILLNQFLYQKESSMKLLMGYLIADTILLATYVYFTGGASNPLISLLLLPVITASVLLCTKTSLAVLLAANACYGLIWWNSQDTNHHMAHGFGDHLIGMWLVFVATSGLIYFIISYLSRINQQQQTLLHQQRQRQVRDEHIMALGLSAADAAHQLNTPLSTLAVSVEDLSEQSPDEVESTVQLMQQQIERCNEITRNMSTQYKQLSNQEFETISISQLLNSLIKNYRLLHPQTILNIDNKDSQDWQNLNIQSHIGLISAFLNILDNAAKASQVNDKDSIGLELALDKVAADKVANNKEVLIINITDQGEGVEHNFYQQYGLVPSEASDKGMGIGSLVSSASIERVGGTLLIANHENGGAKVTVTLPIVRVKG